VGSRVKPDGEAEQAKCADPNHWRHYVRRRIVRHDS
jgi:hypothetical protein